MTTEDQLSMLLAHIRAVLPEEPAAWPGGWPGEIEKALLDAVLSIRAVYGSRGSDKRAATGIPAALQRYEATRGPRPLDDLRVLAEMSPDQLADVLSNRQRVAGGALKTQAVVTAAGRLADVGVRHAADLDPDSVIHRRCYTSVRGLGPVTWEYFCMLLGAEGVKPDRWIVRFVNEAIGAPSSPEDAGALVRQAATSLEGSPMSLDHAIWSYARSRTRTSRSRAWQSDTGQGVRECNSLGCGRLQADA